jgi:succinyl-CoA synthetase beta subunit
VNLHEYQAKLRFGEFGIPVPKGKVATTPDEAFDIAREAGKPVVIKAQVLTGGRGKAGGVKVAKTLDDVREIADRILGMDIKGHTVYKVLVDPAVEIKHEIYLSVTNDRAARKPLVMASSAGGVEIEQVAHETPEKLVREHVDPNLGLRDYQMRNIASQIKLPREHWKQFIEIGQNLYRCFIESDGTLCEINPLAIVGTPDGDRLMALDGKMSIDDNALFRHADLVEKRDTQAEPPEETRARAAGLSYVKLDGNIGCMVNGAGLAMTTMDITKYFAEEVGAEGVGPANFLDIGGGAKADKVAAALRIILADPKVKVVLFNIFGGITRGDEVARGILQALDDVKTSIPMVIRLAGTNAAEGLKIIDEAKLPNITSASSLADAARKAIAAAQGVR